MHDEKLEGVLLERFLQWVDSSWSSLVKDFLPSVLTLLVGLPSSPLGGMIGLGFFCVHRGSHRSNEGRLFEDTIGSFFFHFCSSPPGFLVFSLSCVDSLSGFFSSLSIHVVFSSLCSKVFFLVDSWLVSEEVLPHSFFFPGVEVRCFCRFRSSFMIFEFIFVLAFGESLSLSLSYSLSLPNS